MYVALQYKNRDTSVFAIILSYSINQPVVLACKQFLYDFSYISYSTVSTVCLIPSRLH